jgi:hypothetical protein
MTKRKVVGKIDRPKKAGSTHKPARRKRSYADGVLLEIVRMFDRRYGPPPGRKSF